MATNQLQLAAPQTQPGNLVSADTFQRKQAERLAEDRAQRFGYGRLAQKALGRTAYRALRKDEAPADCADRVVCAPDQLLGGPDGGLVA